MKQKVFILISIGLFFVFGIFCSTVYAKSFHDDFDVLNELNWDHWGEYAIWRTENGLLKGWIQSPPLSVMQVLQ